MTEKGPRKLATFLQERDDSFPIQDSWRIILTFFVNKVDHFTDHTSRGMNELRHIEVILKYSNLYSKVTPIW